MVGSSRSSTSMDAPANEPISRDPPGTLLRSFLTGKVQEPLREWAKLLFLCSFAIAWPLFGQVDLFPAYFACYQCDKVDVTVSSLVVFFFPPCLAFAITRLLGRRLCRWATHSLVFSLCAVLLLQAFDAGSFLGPPVRELVGLTLAGLGVWVLDRLASHRGPVVLMIGGSFWVLLDFLLFSTVSAVYFGEAAVELVEKIPSKANTPIVFVVFDELPLSSLLDDSREVDEQLFPNFRQLSRSSTWYRNATSSNDYTIGAIPALLTGALPRYFDPPVAAVYPRNLFSLLASSYTIRARELGSSLVPFSIRTRDQYLTSRLERLRSVAHDLRVIVPLLLTGDHRSGQKLARACKKLHLLGEAEAASTGEAASTREYQRFLDSLDRSNPRTLHYIHSILPHGPWTQLPHGTFYLANHLDAFTVQFNQVQKDRWLQEFIWYKDDWLVHQNYQRHLLQVMYVDSLLGKLIARLKEVGLYDSSLLVVTSDHGAYFEAGRMLRDSLNPHSPEVTRGERTPTHGFMFCVPLFIKYPGQKQGKTSDDNVEHIDVLPTITEVLGISVGWKFGGSSMISAGRRSRPIKRSQTSRGYSIDMEPVVERKFEDACSRRAWFYHPKDCGDFPWVYRLRPFGDLSGTNLDRVPISPMSDVRVILSAPPDVRAAGRQRPSGCLIGSVVSPRLRKGPLFLLVARHGVALSVTRTAPTDHSPGSFIAFFPEELDGGPEAGGPFASHHRPSNLSPGLPSELVLDLELYVITSRDGEPLSLGRPVVSRSF